MEGSKLRAIENSGDYIESFLNLREYFKTDESSMIFGEIMFFRDK
jgi:hypothetical protein